MRQVAEITLIENSTAGNPPKKHAAQTVEIRHEPDIVVTGLDGIRSYGRQPSTVFWHGGTASQLQHITDVRIIDGHGRVLLDGALNTIRDVPRDIDGGVTFYVLRPDD